MYIRIITIQYLNLGTFHQIVSTFIRKIAYGFVRSSFHLFQRLILMPCSFNIFINRFPSDFVNCASSLIALKLRIYTWARRFRKRTYLNTLLSL